MENNTNPKESQQVFEDSKTNIALEEALMAENFAQKLNKYGYEAGMVYVVKEVKAHYGFDAVAGGIH